MITVDGVQVKLDGEKNILEVIHKAGMNLPTFCYLSELSVYGSCRMCMVEVDGRLVPACSTPPADGMQIKTNTERLRKIRRTIIELLLANHDRECTSCERNGSCRLQSIAYQLGIDKIRFPESPKNHTVDMSSPAIVRNPNKCILCGDCVRMCREVQGLGVLDLQFRGSKVAVGPAFGKPIAEVDCTNCGQCVQVCPTGALSVKNDVPRAWQLVSDQGAYPVVEVAPAVRVALGEAFGLGKGKAVTGKIAAALRRLGFKKVFDTVFAADLTAVEETHELLTRLRKGGPFPMFTSCCPAWVKLVETHYPEFLGNLSTCMSPQQMLGSLIKRTLVAGQRAENQQVRVVSVMPCTAKKFEITRAQFGENRPVDLVLTTSELVRMIKEAGINFEQLEESEFDEPFGTITGGGLLFGATGGVAEAVLRTASRMLGAPCDRELEFSEVRGLQGIREAQLNIGGYELRVCVVHGLGNARRLLEAIRGGEKNYHIVEVMACPGGCAGGGGQPIPDDPSVRVARVQKIVELDSRMTLRVPSDNPSVQEVYASWLGTPGSEKAHECLHTWYGPRRRIAGESIPITPAPLSSEGARPTVQVEVCVGTGCYLRGSYDVLKKLMDASNSDPEMVGRVALKATFCLEHCDRGVSARINGKIITGLNSENVLDIVKRELARAGTYREAQ
ncbi:MAG: [FeFe] hydrogenase, group A [Bacillota bacterium]